jgi:hypothetical protein
VVQNSAVQSAHRSNHRCPPRVGAEARRPRSCVPQFPAKTPVEPCCACGEGRAGCALQTLELPLKDARPLLKRGRLCRRPPQRPERRGRRPWERRQRAAPDRTLWRTNCDCASVRARSGQGSTADDSEQITRCVSHPPHAWPRPETRRHSAPPAPPHQYRWLATQREAVPWLGSHHQVSHLPACSLTPETRGASGTAPSQMARHAARSCSVARIACAR